MRRSSRDIDQQYDAINDVIEQEIQRQLGLQTERVEKQRVVREQAQAQMKLVAERGKKGDKMKVGEEAAEAEVLAFNEPPDMPMNPYRPVHSHNMLIEWVKGLLDTAKGPDVCISVTPSSHVCAGITENLSLKMYVDTIVRAAYFYTLQLPRIATCTLIVNSKEERQHLLTTLRDVRQAVEAEGYDWFI